MARRYLKNKYNIISFYIFITIFIGVILNNKCLAASYEIIKLSETIRENEVELRNLQDQREYLNLKQQQLLKEQKNAQEEISRNILTFYKMQILPLQVLFMGQKSNKDIAITYSVLQYYTNYANSEIQSSKENLQAVEKNAQQYQKVQQRIYEINQNISKNINILKTYLNNKPASNTNLSVIHAQNKKLLQESSSLPEIIKKVGLSYKLDSSTSKDNKFSQQKGKLSWPNVGFINTTYQDNKANSMYYNGITILALPNSQIIAPEDGEVIFTDNFSDYDNVIIIKHSPSYFSIITGNFDSYVLTTQLVKKHEPIALNKNTLQPIYYEFQKNGHPVNPFLWLENKPNTVDTNK